MQQIGIAPMSAVAEAMGGKGLGLARIYQPSTYDEMNEGHVGYTLGFPLTVS